MGSRLVETCFIDFEIDILTEKEESEKRQLEFKDKTEIFIKNLEVDETLGQLLVAEGFSTVDEINQATVEDISKIEAIDENTAQELKTRASEYLKKEKDDIGKKLTELGVENENISKTIEEAKIIEENSNQILDFTREVKNLPEEDKIKIVEALWSIIYSNNDADIYETNLMRRLAGLLYIDNKTMGDIKEKIKQNSK